MSNNLEKLMKSKRKDGRLQQQQIAKKIGVTNVTLCQVQSGQKKLSRSKMIRLATILETPYNELLEIMGYDLQDEWKLAWDKISKTSDEKELFLYLAEVIKEPENVEILKKIISMLVKANEREKEILSNMLEIFKDGLYGI